MACFRTFLGILGWCAFAPAALAQPQREAVRPQAAEIDLWPLTREDLAAECVPVRAVDKVIVSSTLRLFAYDATSGALAWKTEPPAGWEALDDAARARLREGLYPAELLVTPAAANGVVVTGLQLPYARGPAENWQGIPVRVELPERRLFAFDVASGLPMWNHAPPAKWDGKSGTLPERTNVIGPPVILGDRVLVPCTSDPSSIDFLVAAYDLASGQLLWNTFVGRGQVERNSFDAQVREFVAAPLVASPDGERVLVQTGLGHVAALTATDGALVWSVSYPPIPMPKTRSYNVPPRPTKWRIAPPVVVGDVVLAAPRDSTDLLALDLASGELLWSLPNETLRTLSGGVAIDQLIGARDGVLYLGGGHTISIGVGPVPQTRTPAAGIVAVTRPGDLRAEGPWELLWKAPGSSAIRSQLVGACLFTALESDLLELEPATGATLASHALKPLRGLLVTDDALFAVEERALLRLAR